MKMMTKDTYSKIDKISEGLLKDGMKWTLCFSGVVSEGKVLKDRLAEMSIDTIEEDLRSVSKVTKNITFFILLEGGEKYLYNFREELQCPKVGYIFFRSIRSAVKGDVFENLRVDERTEKRIKQTLSYLSLFDKYSDNDYKIHRW